MSFFDEKFALAQRFFPLAFPISVVFVFLKIPRLPPRLSLVKGFLAVVFSSLSNFGEKSEIARRGGGSWGNLW